MCVDVLGRPTDSAGFFLDLPVSQKVADHCLRSICVRVFCPPAFVVFGAHLHSMRKLGALSVVFLHPWIGAGTSPNRRPNALLAAGLVTCVKVAQQKIALASFAEHWRS
jgi:hypothetical protein